MISALADAGAALEEPRYLQAASDCADFLLTSMRDEPGRLLRAYNHGAAKIDGYLEDHAFLLEALLVLFEATCEERWYLEAVVLAEEMIARRKDLEDSPIPAGGSSAAVGLLRLSQLSGDPDHERNAVSVLRLLHEIAPQHPSAFGHLLQALHWYFAPARPIACAVPAVADGGR